MTRHFLQKLRNTYVLRNASKVVRRWRKRKQNHDKTVSEGVVRAMTPLENTLIREVNGVDKQVEYLLNEIEGAKQSQKTINWVALERSYNGDSSSAEASDSRTQIQCILNRVKEFTEKRKFYQLSQATDDAIVQIKEHQEKFPEETLGDEIFNPLEEGLYAHKHSLRLINAALVELKKANIFKERITKQQLKELAEHLERLGEELEDNLPFFSATEFNKLEKICETFVLKTRKKAKNRKGTNEHEREEWRRRVRYAAGFILNLIEIAEEDAIEEDTEVIEDFLAASHSSFSED